MTATARNSTEATPSTTRSRGAMRSVRRVRAWSTSSSVTSIGEIVGRNRAQLAEGRPNAHVLTANLQCRGQPFCRNGGESLRRYAALDSGR